MQNEEKIKQFRQEMAAKLKEWIPDNEVLVAKELGVFDKVMSRREFLTTTSAAAFALLYQGCSNKAPSEWSDAPSGSLSESERLSVTKTSKITVDADLLDGALPYEPLYAQGSSDAPYVKKSAVLEAFNPHVMSVESMEVFETSGLNKPNKNYGGVDIVHLEKEDPNLNYRLKVYEKNEQNSLDPKTIELPNSEDIEYATLVAANGNFHNKVRDGQIYSQKMIAFATPKDAIKSDLRIYYQNYHSGLILPGVDYTQNNDASWEYLDILKVFEYAEEYSFQTYKVVDVNSYSDGEGNSFIYGTLCFDDLYCYGFVVSYTSIYASKARVSFFAPKFLSVKSQTISSLAAKNQEFKNFSLIKHQKFLPFCVIVKDGGEDKNNILFSFVSFDTGSTTISKKGGVYDFKELEEVYNSKIKRYLLSVDVNEGGVQYLLENYEVKKAALEEKNGVITFSFDTSNINLTDLYRDIYKTQDIGYSVAALEMKSAYVRGIRNDGESLHVILVGTYFQTTMGLAHKSIKLDLDTYKVKELHKSVSVLSKSKHGFHTYNSLWFDDLVDGKYKSLHECVEKNNKEYEFFATQNQQGLLRSYFIITIDGVRYLLSYAEVGENPEGSYIKPYNFMNFKNLYDQIKNSSTPFAPPLVVASNVGSFYHTNSGAVEEELIYTAERSREKDTKLLSYYHVLSDALEGTWSTKEIQGKPSNSKISTHTVKGSRHIVHMYMNNLYGHQTVLEKERYVELRFTKPVSVYDLTNMDTPKGYDVRRDVSLFVKPDENGKIVLEIDSGLTHQEMFNGVSILYRIVHENDMVTYSENSLVTFDNSSAETTTFQHFNISFKMMERLSSDKVDTFQAGVLQSGVKDPKTAYTLLHQYAKNGEKSNIKKATNLYGKLYESAAPKNGETLSSVTGNFNSDTAKLSPLVFISRDELYTGIIVGKSSFSKWLHHAISTIKHAVHKAVETVAQKLKKSLDKLVPKIEDLLSNASVSLESVLTVLCSILDKMVDLAHKFILYLKEFWDFIKGFFDFKTAFDIGEEFKNIFKAQMLPDKNNPDNVYGLLKEETQNIQDKIGDIAQHLKENIDTAIDNAFASHAKKIDDTIKKDSANNDSVKRDHALHTTVKVYHDKVKSAQPIKPIDDNLFSCNSSESVEQLLSCVMHNISNTASKDMKDIYKNSERIFSDFVKNRGIGNNTQALANILKDTSNVVIDEYAIIADGLVQMPLAFLNGSSTLSLVEEALDDDLKIVFEILGLIFFDDETKFKSLDDVGYFIFGYIIFFNLTIVDISKVDLVGYIKDGEFRSDINNVVSGSKNRQRVASSNGDDVLQKVVTVCGYIDASLAFSLIAGNYFMTNSTSVSKFNILNKILMIGNFIRILLRIPTFIKHIELDANTDTKQLEKASVITADIFHTAALIIQVFRAKTYSFEYIEEGAEVGGVFSGLSVIHALLGFIEASGELIAVTPLSNSDDEQKQLQILTKVLGEIGSFPAAILDLFSGSSKEEFEMSAVTFVTYTSIGVLVLCYIGIGVIKLDFYIENHNDG